MRRQRSHPNERAIPAYSATGERCRRPDGSFPQSAVPRKILHSNAVLDERYRLLGVQQRRQVNGEAHRVGCKVSLFFPASWRTVPRISLVIQAGLPRIRSSVAVRAKHLRQAYSTWSHLVSCNKTPGPVARHSASASLLRAVISRRPLRHGAHRGLPSRATLADEPACRTRSIDHSPERYSSQEKKTRFDACLTRFAAQEAPVAGYQSTDAAAPATGAAAKTPFWKTRKFIICQIVRHCHFVLVRVLTECTPDNCDYRNRYDLRAVMASESCAESAAS